jgi:hypothetical protein
MAHDSFASAPLAHAPSIKGALQTHKVALRLPFIQEFGHDALGRLIRISGYAVVE